LHWTDAEGFGHTLDSERRQVESHARTRRRTAGRAPHRDGNYRDDRSEEWQESERGEEFQEKLDLLQEAIEALDYVD
jgi:hypothetical protein